MASDEAQNKWTSFLQTTDGSMLEISSSSLIGGRSQWGASEDVYMVSTSNAPLGHMLFGKVFGWFWDGLGRFLNAKTKIKRKRVDVWECSFYLRDIDAFNGCGLHLGWQKEREKQSGKPIWIPTRFCDDFLIILDSLWEQKSFKNQCRFWRCFAGSLGGAAPSGAMPGSIPAP